MDDDAQLRAALTPLINELSLWRVHPAVGARKVVTTACDLLVAGMDSPSLRMLAGESVNSNVRDISPLIERTITELGGEHLLPDSNEEERRAIWAMCEHLLDGAIAVRELTAWAHIAFSHYGPGDAADLAQLDDEFDGSDTWGRSSVQITVIRQSLTTASTQS